MNAVTNSEGDTIYSDWTVLKLPDEIDYQTELDHIFVKGLEVAFYMDEILSEGEQWDKNAMYWFKYLDSDIIDYFRVNDKGVYQEYREISIYLNEEPIEPIHQSEGGENFFFQFIKNEF